MTREARTGLVVGIAVAVAGLASFGVYRAIQRIPVREVEVGKATMPDRVVVQVLQYMADVVRQACDGTVDAFLGQQQGPFDLVALTNGQQWRLQLAIIGQADELVEGGGKVLGHGVDEDGGGRIIPPENERRRVGTRRLIDPAQ